VGLNPEAGTRTRTRSRLPLFAAISRHIGPKQWCENSKSKSSRTMDDLLLAFLLASSPHTTLVVLSRMPSYGGVVDTRSPPCL
jgi:hypothetical protein